MNVPEIDSYLEFRKRRGEKLTDDSYLIVKKFGVKIEDYRSMPFNPRSLRAILEYHIISSGIREIDHINQFKRKQIPVFHGFRKFFTKQLVESKLNPEIREMLLGHKIGLTSAYYKPSEQEMLSHLYLMINEGLVAIPDKYEKVIISLRTVQAKEY